MGCVGGVCEWGVCLGVWVGVGCGLACGWGGVGVVNAGVNTTQKAWVITPWEVCVNGGVCV